MEEDWDLHFLGIWVQMFSLKGTYSNESVQEMIEEFNKLLQICVVPMQSEDSYYFISCIWKIRWIWLPEELY